MQQIWKCLFRLALINCLALQTSSCGDSGGDHADGLGGGAGLEEGGSGGSGTSAEDGGSGGGGTSAEGGDSSGGAQSGAGADAAGAGAEPGGAAGSAGVAGIAGEIGGSDKAAGGASGGGADTAGANAGGASAGSADTAGTAGETDGGAGVGGGSAGGASPGGAGMGTGGTEDGGSSGGTQTGGASVGGTPAGGAESGGSTQAGGVGAAGMGAGGVSAGGAAGAGGAGTSDLVNPIHVLGTASAADADGTLEHPFMSLEAAVTAILATATADIPWDGRIIVHEARYEVTSTIELPLTADIEFEAGVTMAMGADVSLHAQRNVKILGTEAKRVVFTWLVDDEPWGTFTLFAPESQANEVDWATFEHASSVTYKEVTVRGGLALEGAGGTIRNSIFQDCTVDDGMSLGTAPVTVDHCSFVNNKGDGLDIDGPGVLEISFCTFDGNGNDGLDLGEGADVWVHDNVLKNNEDSGIEVGEGATPRLERNLILSNHMGIGIDDDGDPLSINNTLYGNEYGITSYHTSDDYGSGKGNVVNTIIWGSTVADIALVDGGTLTFSYSCVQSGSYTDKIDVEEPSENFFDLTGTGLLSQTVGCSDPRFVDVESGDFHLMSTAGHWNPSTEAWVTDAQTSPCIDTGDPDLGVGSEPVPNGGRIDMGAYGGTAEASHSP